METIFSLNDFFTIFGLLILLVILIFLIKFVNGDFSPISIEEIDRQIIDNEDLKTKTSTRQILITYKKTYKDGNVRITYKKLNLN